MAADRSLKSQNMKWLVMLAVLDMLIVLLFVIPEVLTTATASQVTIWRGLTASVLPVAILLITGVLSHDQKARLVYWKLNNVLPGCEAFTKHGPADGRIDMTALKKNVGALPVEYSEQNSKWFKLYQVLRDDLIVVEAHKLYLLYRDMTTLSLPLVVLVPIGVFFAGGSPTAQWVSAGVFAAQFLISSIAARNSGVRLVCNVLAIHSSRKITT